MSYLIPKHQLPEWANFNAADYRDYPANDKEWKHLYYDDILGEFNNEIEDIAAVAAAYRYEIVRLRKVSVAIALE